jgi:hypothetical protein
MNHVSGKASVAFGIARYAALRHRFIDSGSGEPLWSSEHTPEHYFDFRRAGELFPNINA